MAQFETEFTLRLHEPMVFDAGPPKRAEPIVFNIKQPPVTAKLFVDDVDDYVMTHVDGVPLVTGAATACKVLRIAIGLTAPPDVATALEAGRRTKATAAWGEELLAVFDRVASAVIDYARNVKKQFWLERVEVDPHATVDELLRHWHASIIIGAHARELIVSPGVSMTVGIPRRGNGLNSADLASLVTFVEKGKPSAAWQEFDANALRERAWGNHRAAVIEAVTAFEALVKRLYPRVVLKQFGEGEVQQTDLESLFEKAGLRTTVTVFVKLTLRRAGWTGELIEYLFDAINLRNELIHNSRRRPDRERAVNAVSAMHRAITELESAWGA